MVYSLPQNAGRSLQSPQSLSMTNQQMNVTVPRLCYWPVQLPIASAHTKPQQRLRQMFCTLAGKNIILLFP